MFKMSAFLCFCKVQNYLGYFLQIHKYVVQQNLFYTHILNSKYRCITYQSLPIIGLQKSIKWNHFKTEQNYFSYKPKFNNTKSLKVKENVTTNKNIGNIDEKIELMKSDIETLNRVYIYDVNSLHNSIRDVGTCSNDQSVFLLNCCGKLLPDVDYEVRTALAFSVWKTLRDIKHPLTLDHYNALLLSLADNRHAISVNEFLSDIQQDGLTLDATCCVNLLRCVCEVGDIKQVMQINTLILDYGTESSQVFDYIVLGHGRARDLETVKSLTDNLDKSSTLAVILQVSAEAGQKDMFSSYLNKAQMLSEEQRLDVSVSLAVGNLTEFIPTVLNLQSWSEKGVVQANNTSTQLVHLGHPEAGMTVLTTLAKHAVHDETTFADFFIKELLNSDTEVGRIINICNVLSKHNSRSLLKAAEYALALWKTDFSIQLLREMKKQGHPIRPHYFWPLIISASKQDGRRGILNILGIMHEMEVTPDFDTIKDYVLSRCECTKMADIVTDLRNEGLSLADIMTPALHYLLKNGKIEEAVELCSMYKANRIDWKLLLNELAYSFIATGNVTSTVALLSFADNSVKDNFVKKLMVQRRKAVQPQYLELLLKALKDKGYEFSASTFSPDQDLSVVNTRKDTNSRNDCPLIPNPSQMNLEELECHLLELKAKKLNTRGILRKLFQLHCSLNNLKRASEIKKELFEGGFTFSSGMLASLFQLYTSAEDIQEAEICLKELKQNHPHFKLDSYKIVDFATVLVNNKQYPKALLVLEAHKSEKDESKMVRNCWRLLSAVAAVEGISEAKKVLAVLLTNNYAKVSGELLSPLINTYIERNDLNGAVSEFENCVKTYRKSPMAYKLLCTLSKCKEDSLLEKVLNIGKKLHGVSNFNITFILALAEENLSSQLIKVVTSPGFVLNTEGLLAKCNYFVDKNKPLSLENIVHSLIHVPSVNVEPFCHLILEICVKQDNYDAAVKLCTSMQELNIIPSDKFSNYLRALMDRHERDNIVRKFK